jgi:hypothetical protein
MTDVPEGARLSDDGHWWWDENGQQWQPVPGGGSGAAPGSAEGGAGGAGSAQGGAGGDGAEGDAGATGAGDADRAAARVAAGLPASLHEVTDEQRAQYLSEPEVSVEPVEHEEVEVVAMDDSGGGDGEAVA